MMVKKVGIITAGGDCPGLNAVIRGIVKTAEYANVETYGFLEGYKGLLENRYIKLDSGVTSDIISKGGTILGSNNKTNTFAIPVENDLGEIEYVDKSTEIVERLKKDNYDCLIVIGGDGSLKSARDYTRRGIPVIGVPKTIDNDVPNTDTTFGFYTAVEIATEAIDRIKTTAESHGRVLVLEVMGRYAGWIALAAGIAGGADTILIPEIPYDLNAIVNKIKQRKEKRGKNYSVIIVAEGAKPIGGDISIKSTVGDSPDSIRLGGAGEYVAKEIEKLTGKEARNTTLGYIQRGGNTGPYDRILSTELGSMAMQLAIEEKFNEMVTLLNGKITHVSLDEVAGKDTEIGAKSSNIKRVDLNGDLVQTARRIGICLGDN
ncbi:MAG: ATP-dependent 6-phosphofructokinase [Clostridia bacterium]|nr:ATP-dependent 6-phosphofructokinase [Clostridia bacterium]